MRMTTASLPSAGLPCAAWLSKNFAPSPKHAVDKPDFCVNIMLWAYEFIIDTILFGPGDVPAGPHCQDGVAPSLLIELKAQIL